MIPVTVVIPTSPIPSCPSTSIIASTIASVRESLSGAKIVIDCDGDESSSWGYAEYIGRLDDIYDNVKFHTKHVHQSGMLPSMLEDCDTPLLLYLEHDWLLLPDIPWDELAALILRGDFNSIKLHANPRISPYYEHMMESRVMYQSGIASDRHTDQLPLPVVPIIKTRQWSQNPHLASTAFYRDKILPMVAGKCDFVENIIHGIVANSPWDEYKTGIYNPPGGDMMRIQHLDGKGTRL